MPLYQQLIVALPKYPNEGLVKLMQKFSKVVMDNGGVVRSVENNGVRPLAERAKRKYATAEGQRYFWNARYITATFDASPKVLIETDRFLKNEEGVLRSFSLKMRTSYDRSKEMSYRNKFSNVE